MELDYHDHYIAIISNKTLKTNTDHDPQTHNINTALKVDGIYIYNLPVSLTTSNVICPSGRLLMLL